MKQRLERLKVLSAALEPPTRQRQHWTREVIAHAQSFLTDLPGMPAFRSIPGEGREILRSKFSEDGQEVAPVF